MSSDEEDQHDEILALREICGNDFQTMSPEDLQQASFAKSEGCQETAADDQFKFCGRIDVEIDLTDTEMTVEYQHLSEDSRRRTFDFAVKHLLPLRLTFLLPSNYPSVKRPLLSVECPWITRKQKRILLEEIYSLWQPGVVFLFSAVNFLKEQTLQVLGIESTINLNPVLREIAKLSDRAQKPPPNEAIPSKDEVPKEGAPSKETETCAAGKYPFGSGPPPKHETRFGFVQKYINDRAFGFIRCIGDGRIPPTSELDYDAVKNVKKGSSEGEGKFQDVYFRKRSVAVDSSGQKIDFFKRRGTPVQFTLSVATDNRTEARMVRLFDWTVGTKETAISSRTDHDTTKPESLDRSDKSPKAMVADDGSGTDEASGSKVPTESSLRSNSKQSTCDYSTPSLVKKLQDHHNEREEEIFFNQLFDCMVCFATKPGAKSIRFPGCCHVYCKSCMKSYFEVQIGQGMMSNLTCPEEGCKSQALPTQIKDIVEQSAYDMYETQLLQTTLEGMTDVEFCPRLKCQCATIVDREMNMGQCPKCQYAFCVLCKQAYHGQTPCSINSKEKIDLLEEYLNGDADRKAELEKRYGQKHLKHLSENYLSDVYMRDKAKKCPKCQTPIEKSDGCNKMTCHRCNTYFCYLCEAYLPRHNPYGHFSDRTTMCFNQLFQGIDNMDDIIDEQWQLDDEDEWDDEDGWEVPVMF